MDAVLAYKRRKRLRLMERGYRADKSDEVTEWITTEKGVHIPLDENKVAVGGALEGEKFESASGKTKGKRDKRKQRDIPNAGKLLFSNGRVRDDRMKEFNEAAFKSIVEETGYSEQDAKKFHENLLDFFGGDYKAFADGSHKDEEENINAGLERMKAYDGEIYRGMVFEDWQEDLFSKFMDCNVGDEIEMRTISSWSSNKSVADEFAKMTSVLQKNSVVLVCKNNKSGVGVQHISKFAKKEAEVLAPSTAKWRLTGKKVINRYKHLRDYYSNKPDMGKEERARVLGTIDAFKNRLSEMNVITLEVEEL